MKNTIENEFEIDTKCELENKEFEIITNKKERLIEIYNLDGKKRHEKPLFVTKISKDDDIVECHQRMIEYMCLNNRIPNVDREDEDE